MEMIEEVQRRKKEIAGLEKPQWKTNCSFSYEEGRAGVNLHVYNDVRGLILMAAFLAEKFAAYTKAVTTLQIENPPAFMWSGFPVEDWLADIKTRVNKIQIGDKKRKLAEFEERLNKIISPEKRRELELAAIAAELEN